MTFVTHNISVHHGAQKIISACDMRIESKQVHILMGPNGSGKTSLALALAGHPQYTVQGSVSLDAHDISEWSAAQRAQHGMFLAMQQPPAIEGVTVGNFLRLAKNTVSSEPVDPLAFLNTIKTEIRHVGLDDTFISRYVHVGFSGGEKKRFSLLELRILRPALAILDEPDAGLDVDGMKLLQHTVRELADAGTAFLIITHDTTLARAIHPDRVSVLSAGKIVATGHTDVLSTVEQSGYTAFI